MARPVRKRILIERQFRPLACLDLCGKLLGEAKYHLLGNPSEGNSFSTDAATCFP